ncbi:MAG: CRISPR system precrRNA processing endoribonuclease RAMP protein Cas6 [Pseudoxanthomonas sp.]
MPIARLHLDVRAETPLHLPPYAGSMLRGAFGHALLELAPLPHEDGKPCTLHDRCAYCQVFATLPLATGHSLQKFNRMPAPYVIEPPATTQPRTLLAGDTFQFSLVLIGKAWQHLPTLVLAFERAMQRGLGQRDKVRCTLLNVHQENNDTPFWQAGQSCPSLQPPSLPSAAAIDNRITLHLQSPLRMQVLDAATGKNKPARKNQLDARTFLMALARRQQLLLDVYHGNQTTTLDFAALAQHADTIELDASQLHWFDWARFSNRQNRTMKLGGLIGTLQLQGMLAPFAELLHLGQWLHAGKETTFGLGQYRLAH